MRLSKKISKPKILGNNSELDINWASGPGFRGGPENYFCVNVEADDHNFALEFNVDESRSQHKNREIAEDRLLKLLEEALKVPKRRKKTSPSKTSVERRLKTKRVVAKKKTSRKKPEED